MKIRISALAFLIFAVACNKDDGTDDNKNIRDYKQDMREFVMGISAKAKTVNPDFAVIPQNGIELVTIDGDKNGAPHIEYLDAIDGNGQEDLFFGYDNDDSATPDNNTAYLREFIDISKNKGNTILVTDYCITPFNITSSYQYNAAAGYISYAAPERDLNVIPNTTPNNVNHDDITSLSQVRNFLYLINPENFNSKEAFIAAVTATDYDAVIMDLFLEDEMFTATEIAQLKQKANGGTRMVICYMSIGEAEDYRYYWDNSWSSNKPEWIVEENPDWLGNFKVKYWDGAWQDIIYKKSDSYLDKIIIAGFDGVYLDIIDAFEYFE